MRPQKARQIIPLFATALLAGCGTTPPAAQIVEVPVYTPCVREMPAAPTYEFDKLSVDSSAGDKVLALARDWPVGRKYEGELLAVILGCR
jgi:hypothetical protein